jgi:hypothetical protein
MSNSRLTATGIKDMAKTPPPRRRFLVASQEDRWVCRQ